MTQWQVQRAHQLELSKLFKNLVTELDYRALTYMKIMYIEEFVVAIQRVGYLAWKEHLKKAVVAFVAVAACDPGSVRWIAARNIQFSVIRENVDSEQAGGLPFIWDVDPLGGQQPFSYIPQDPVVVVELVRGAGLRYHPRHARRCLSLWILFVMAFSPVKRPAAGGFTPSEFTLAYSKFRACSRTPTACRGHRTMESASWIHTLKQEGMKTEISSHWKVRPPPHSEQRLLSPRGDHSMKLPPGAVRRDVFTILFSTYLILRIKLYGLYIPQNTSTLRWREFINEFNQLPTTLSYHSLSSKPPKVVCAPRSGESIPADVELKCNTASIGTFDQAQAAQDEDECGDEAHFMVPQWNFSHLGMHDRWLPLTSPGLPSTVAGSRKERRQNIPTSSSTCFILGQ
ncbi:hypothetical protein BS47DRAFT_1388941 [Hydnum rufescens UP504]|uniref:Uncharacterized protein n=1 Tax=Hydnum rufescens UP504 TaxID=1448309 RepID=A0A9P6B6A9_9AGAM|nr:hypothetical protein BS47DRAFT_1388941 [Hydnum rufescens UP504]